MGIKHLRSLRSPGLASLLLRSPTISSTCVTHVVHGPMPTTTDNRHSWVCTADCCVLAVCPNHTHSTAVLCFKINDHTSSSKQRYREVLVVV